MTWFFIPDYLYRKVDQQLFIGVCPLKYIGGLSTKLFIGVCPLSYIRGLSIKTNIFVVKIVFHTWQMHVRESVRTRGMRHDM